MSVKFKTITRKNPRDLAAPEKYYPSSVTRSVLDLDKLADLVGDGSTVRRNDVYAVGRCCQKTIRIREYGAFGRLRKFYHQCIG